MILLIVTVQCSDTINSNIRCNDTINSNSAVILLIAIETV